jgi:type I restriction enzyme S subunit
MVIRGFNTPQHWDVIPLAELTETGNVSYGIVQPGKYDPNGVPIIRVNNFDKNRLNTNEVLKVSPNIENKFLKTRLREGDVLLTLVGSTGLTYVVPKKHEGWNVARAVAVIRPNSLVTPEWINICLGSITTAHFLDSRANTTVQKTINLSDVKKIPIPLPPACERKVIENIAGSLSDKILNCTEQNKTLEQMAQALFKSWFVDFDPVIDNALAASNPIPDELQERAELRQRVIAERTANPKLKPLPDDIQQLFPSEFEESELGWIPKGWSAGVMSDHAAIKMGNSPKGDTYNISGIGTPLVNGPVEFGTYFTKRAKWTTAPTKLSSKNDLIVCVRGSTTGKYVKSDGIYCIGRGVCSVTGKQSQVFTDQLFKQSIRQMLGLTTGSTFPNWSRQTLSNFTVVNPEKPIVQLFDNIVQPIINKVEQGTLECETLEVMRDALLPKLISGEITI